MLSILEPLLLLLLAVSVIVVVVAFGLEDVEASSVDNMVLNQRYLLLLSTTREDVDGAEEEGWWCSHSFFGMPQLFVAAAVVRTLRRTGL